MGWPARRRTVFHGRLFRVDVERWQRPEREREIVRHPGAAAIVAVTDGDDVVLIRQLREAVGERLLEIPAGTLDVPGESPAEAAARELREETGYRAARVRPLGRIWSSPGFTDERIELFQARAEPDGDPEEGIEVVPMPFDEAVAAVVRGRILDAKTALGLLWAARDRDRERPF